MDGLSSNWLAEEIAAIERDYETWPELIKANYEAAIRNMTCEPDGPLGY